MTLRLSTIFLTTAVGWTVGANAALYAQPGGNQKLEAAYRHGAERFENDLAQVEREYAAEIAAAQAKRAQGIKMARARYLQGLKFLNSNPSLSQALREQINEEMKRIQALPEPVAPKLGAPPAQQPQQTVDQKVAIRLETPDSGWKVQILQIKQVNNELWVLSALSHEGDVAATVITAVSDAVTVKVPEKLPVRHFVLNKTWEWKNKEDVQFIRAVPDLGRNWALGKIVSMHRN